MDNDFKDKTNRVNQAIDDFSQKLAGDKTDEKIRNEVEKIFLGVNSRSIEEEAKELTKVLSLNSNEDVTKISVRAKAVGLGIKKWIKKNTDEVGAFRSEKLTTTLVEKTKSLNPDIIDNHLKLTRLLSQNVNLLYNYAKEIKNHEDVTLLEDTELKKFYNDSPGKFENIWNDARGISGALRLKPQELDSLIQEHDQITENLKSINLPSDEQGGILASYDRVINYLKKAETRKFFESLRGSVLPFKSPEVFMKKTMRVLFHGGFGGGEIRDLETSFKSNTSSGLENLTTSGTSLLKKSTNDLFSKLGRETKNFLGKSFDKLGGSIIKGLNAAGSMSMKSASLFSAKIILPIIIIGVFVLIFATSILETNSNISGLVPRLEITEGNRNDYENENGGEGSFRHGNITYIDGNRIKDCGVSMDADFLRKNRIRRVQPEDLINGNYDKQLEEAIGDQYGKRCGVVYAAQYLAYDFDYWVPYYWAGKYPMKGLYQRWGKEVAPDIKGRIYLGLDCSGFNIWTQINGYGKRKWGVKTVSFDGNCEKIKSIIEPGDTLTLFKGGYHVAVVVAYDNEHIKFAHSGGGSGVTTGLINICTGQGVKINMNFEYLNHKDYEN